MKRRISDKTMGCYLLPETREMINHCYSGFAVTVVTEIRTNDTLIYIIQLENRSLLTNLRIRNGKFDRMENYSKN